MRGVGGAESKASRRLAHALEVRRGEGAEGETPWFFSLNDLETEGFAPAYLKEEGEPFRSLKNFFLRAVAARGASVFL